MIERKFKHKTTGEIGYYKDGFFKQDRCVMQIGVEPSSEFWEEVAKDYEILSFQSKNNKWYTPTIQKDGTYLAAKINEYDGNGATLEWMLNEDEYYIYSVKRLSDGEILKIGDKIKYKLANKGVKTIVGIVLKDDNIWLQTDLENRNHGMGLEYAEKVKEPLFTTYDRVELFGGEKAYLVTDTFQQGFLLNFDTEDFKNTKGKIFAEKSKAEEYVKQNEPKYSLKDIEDAIKYYRPQTPTGYTHIGELFNRLKNGK
jgi:hypothetical protein